MPNRYKQASSMAHMDHLYEIAELLVLVSNRYGLSTPQKLKHDLNPKNLISRSFDLRSKTSSFVSIDFPQRNRYLFQRRNLKGWSWMVQMPAAPERLFPSGHQFCFPRTRGIRQGWWVSVPGQRKLFRRKRSRKMIGTRARHSLQTFIMP